MMRDIFIRACATLVLLLSVASCSDNTPACLPGTLSTRCSCPNGEQGRRMCSEDGTSPGACFCGEGVVLDAGVDAGDTTPADAGLTTDDAGLISADAGDDAGLLDPDAGGVDAGPQDAGSSDAGAVDAGG